MRWCVGVALSSAGAGGGGGRTWKATEGLEAFARATAAEKAEAAVRHERPRRPVPQHLHLRRHEASVPGAVQEPVGEERAQVRYLRERIAGPVVGRVRQRAPHHPEESLAGLLQPGRDLR